MDNPALADLGVLDGAWRIELSNAEFLDAGAIMTGRLSVDWIDGALPVLRSAMDDAGPPASVSVVGRNESRDEYVVLYADERGVSRVYAMTFTPDGSGGYEWVQHRADPGFHQRFRASVGSGRITGSWHRSHDDGATWEHDFDLTYTRVDER